MNYLNEFVGKGLSEWTIFELIVLNMPWMVVLAVPMGVLFSTLMTFGNMGATQEITIIKASGGSLIRMMIPILFLGVILTVGLFYFNDYILPNSNHRASVLMKDIKRKKPTFSLESGRFSSELEGFTILPRRVDTASGMLYGVTIYDHKSATRRNIISADSGLVHFSTDYKNLIVDLFDGEIHQLSMGDMNNYRIINFEDYQIGMDAHGFAFDRTSDDVISRGDRELSISDMEKIVEKANNNADSARYRIDKIFNDHILYLLNSDKDMPETSNTPKTFVNPSDSSYNAALSEAQRRLSFLRSKMQSDIFQIEEYTKKANQYEVEIHKKYAIPIACFVFVLVGCPLGIITKRGNFGLSAGVTLLFYIVYWICLIGGEKLADRGYLSPFLSMWLGNFVIGFVGILLTIQVNSESLKFFGVDFFRRIFKKKTKL